MPSNKTPLVVIAVGFAILAGCSSSPTSSSSSATHTAYVSLPSSNAVGGFLIDNTTAQITAILGSPYPGGSSPASVVVHPSNKFVYAANQSGNDISLFTINSTLGSLLEVLPRTATGITPVFLAMDKGGNFLFVVNQVSSSISVYAINSGNGTLTPVGAPVSTPPNPFRLALTPSEKFLYVLNTNLGAVIAYMVNAGVLQPVAGPPVQVGNGPLAITVDPAENFVYVANSADNTVSVLSIDSTTGALTLLGSYTTGTTPTSVAVLGQFLFVANLGSSNISVFSVAPGTGVLTQVTSSPFSAGTAPLFEVIDPNNLFLYVGSQTAKSITALTIDTTTGALAVTTQSTPTTTAPSSMSVSK